ncbi:hypothetical protein NA56DRAFT_700890 [Hyaloscypha hepaticicola]|uniref:Uncharacterized protein n=1 Tax=Hyaloscypha hepaticicola TaxID=2082293 RepID=A0A2J6QDR7_9HELO|nr:hypothetical protein NA56DRAFT_700890 [Hyaloscypha hepaticicola]
MAAWRRWAARYDSVRRRLRTPAFDGLYCTCCTCTSVMVLVSAQDSGSVYPYLAWLPVATKSLPDTTTTPHGNQYYPYGTIIRSFFHHCQFGLPPSTKKSDLASFSCSVASGIGALEEDVNSLHKLLCFAMGFLLLLPN